MNRPFEVRERMTPDRWQHVRELLADAIDCPIPQRQALLDARCTGDSSLRQEVESLLIAHEGAGVLDYLAPLVKPPDPQMPTPAAEWSGRRTAQYFVKDSLGSGGMGVVYKAQDERLGRQVALKFLPPHLSADADAKSRFTAEARAAAALDHPNVCTIYEIGETEDGQLFMAMPLYEGETLEARLTRGRLTFDEALPIALQVARALEHAHECGIVHRDVKPSNIVVLPNGAAKVLDFGIAQIHERSIIDPQKVIGTISYMSPEQASAGPVDCRSDIWSLGIVIHEMLASARPFHGDDGRAIVQAILTRDPSLTATSYPDVPVGMDRVLRRALAKAPEQRYNSMSHFAAELSALATAPEDGSHAFHELDTAAWMSTERRHVAVLVTMVSDYPSLVDQMTPIEVQRLVALVRDTAVDVMRRYGGLVNQAIGDEIVSLFGVPMAHDDDDLRAVRAALELHACVRALNRPDGPAGITLRVQSGLHVGPVVARRLPEGPRRYDVVGAPAAMAARLAALADADAVLMSPETQRLAGPYLHTAPYPSAVLDPQAGAVTPFLVVGETGIASRLEASSRTGLTPYVGRQFELSMLQSRVAGAAAGLGAVIAVIGEAGAGKSRLLYELQERVGVATNVRVLRAHCRAYGDSMPYGVFVQILCAALDLRSPHGNADAVAARIRAVDASLERFLPLLLHLLFVSSDRYALPRHLQGEHLQAALLDALAAVVGVMTQRAPLVLLIEDWQWADSGSRAAFIRVAELIGSSRLVLIVTSRVDPGVTNEWPPSTILVRLERLDFAASITIMQAILGVRRVSDALARRLYDRAGGNPFFLEQMCTALLEQQAVTLHDGEAVVDGGEGGLSLPETVQGVIRARLDNLNSHVLEIVRVASVIGAEFDYALVAKVAPSHVDLAPAITALEAAGLVQQVTVAPTISYRFTHALTQEVCYDSLVGHQRKLLHGAIGRALASTHANQMDDNAARLAYHFNHAEDWPAAIQFGRRAVERAIAVSQFADALSALDQVLEWVGHLPDDQRSHLRADLLLQQERLCETLGLRSRQQRIIDSLIADLAREGSSARLAEVYLRQGDLSTLLKRFDAADRALGTALRIGHERGEATLLRSGLRSLGLLRWHEGRHAEALDITHRLLALDRQYRDDVAVAVDLTNLGNILKATGDYAGARAALDEALAMPALTNDTKKLLYTRQNLANIYRAVGDLDSALECLIQNDEVARLHFLPIQQSYILTSIAHIQLQQGHVETALHTYRAAVDLSRRARHADGLVQSLRMLGNALLALARYDEALPCLQEAAQLFAQLEDRESEAEMWTGVARILERESPDEAAQAWHAVLAIQRKLGDSRSELDAREGVARAMRCRGPDEAIPAFESALALAATIGERRKEVSIRNVLGILEWARGGYAEALQHYEAALALIRGEGEAAQEALILNSLGVSLTKLGRPDEARTVLEESLVLSQRAGQRQLEAHALAGLGQVSLSVHNLNSAAGYFEQSRLVRHDIGDRAGEGWMQLRLAELRNRIGDRIAARTAMDAAVTIAAESGDQALLGATEAARHTDHG
ncbi:MAG TPA: tetratricopeptide repeat protein [Vicinamibacterales bacterium]|nr:tetratricopeptide repeat protein [Vicinamibacterales bacterium]